MWYNLPMANTFYIESKYAKLLSARLPNYKHSKSDLWAFSHHCEKPAPGKKAKARCFIYTRQGKLFVRCHHCGYSRSFATFIKETDPVLADEYRLEMYKAKVDSGDVIQRLAEVKKTDNLDIFREATVNVPRRDEVLTGLKSLSELPRTHPAVKYAVSRCIPTEHFDRIFFASKFFQYGSRFKEEFGKVKPEHDYPRLVFPYFDANDRVYAMTARAFGKEEPKYVYLQISGNNTNVYGLWRVDPSRKIIVTEGQIDSLCLDNAIAVGGADYSNPLLKQLQSNCVIVPDNDFVRNVQVAGQIEKAIRLGYSVSLFPANFKHKDINDAVRAGMKSEELRDMILSNAKSGLEAKLELIYRRKR